MWKRLKKYKALWFCLLSIIIACGGISTPLARYRSAIADTTDSYTATLKPNQLVIVPRQLILSRSSGAVHNAVADIKLGYYYHYTSKCHLIDAETVKNTLYTDKTLPPAGMTTNWVDAESGLNSTTGNRHSYFYRYYDVTANNIYQEYSEIYEGEKDDNKNTIRKNQLPFIIDLETNKVNYVEFDMYIPAKTSIESHTLSFVQNSSVDGALAGNYVNQSYLEIGLSTEADVATGTADSNFDSSDNLVDNLEQNGGTLKWYLFDSSSGQGFLSKIPEKSYSLGQWFHFVLPISDSFATGAAMNNLARMTAMDFVSRYLWRADSTNYQGKTRGSYDAGYYAQCYIANFSFTRYATCALDADGMACVELGIHPGSLSSNPLVRLNSPLPLNASWGMDVYTGAKNNAASPLWDYTATQSNTETTS